MHPELFRLPFIDVTLKSYGLMLVIGFLAAIWLIRYLSRNITPDPQLITNAALYSLIAGVVGSRLFYVIHHFDKFRGSFFSIFAIWQGGLELLGGVLLAIAVIVAYLKYHKLPIRRYLDILAIALMLALSIGRIGCFLNGCCFGKPSKLPWAVRFPYGSDAYRSQTQPDLKRNRPEPYLILPQYFFGYYEENGLWHTGLKPYESLSEVQKILVEKGSLRCLPVHPTQIYSSINALIICLVLYLFWKRSTASEKQKHKKTKGRKKKKTKTKKEKEKNKPFTNPGSTFALMFILYGVTRFFMEFLRDDNPFEYGWWAVYRGGTISQNISILMVTFGAALMYAFTEIKPDNIQIQTKKPDIPVNKKRK